MDNGASEAKAVKPDNFADLIIDIAKQIQQTNAFAERLNTSAYKLGGPFELPPGQPPSDKVEAKVSSLEMLRTQKIELRLANDKLEAITCAFERFSN